LLTRIFAAFVGTTRVSFTLVAVAYAAPELIDTEPTETVVTVDETPGAGVAAADAVDADDVPAAFVAVTLNV
jgi:hypothetical protein